jgi:hypothetical protein
MKMMRAVQALASSPTGVAGISLSKMQTDVPLAFELQLPLYRLAHGGGSLSSAPLYLSPTDTHSNSLCLSCLWSHNRFNHRDSPPAESGQVNEMDATNQDQKAHHTRKRRWADTFAAANKNAARTSRDTTHLMRIRE